MKIKLDEITFSNEEIVSYLEKKGFKVETHNTFAGSINNTSWNSNKQYAIPINEEFDEKTHKKINDVFSDLINSGVKNFLTKL